MRDRRTCRICGRPLDTLIQRFYCLACRLIAGEWRKG